jgi:hypothetical protein
MPRGFFVSPVWLALAAPAAVTPAGSTLSPEANASGLLRFAGVVGLGCAGGCNSRRLGLDVVPALYFRIPLSEPPIHVTPS